MHILPVRAQLRRLYLARIVKMYVVIKVVRPVYIHAARLTVHGQAAELKAEIAVGQVVDVILQVQRKAADAGSAHGVVDAKRRL